DARNVHAQMHGFFFAGEKKIQIVCRSVNRPCSSKKADRKNPINTFLKGSGKIAHEPEGHAAGIAAGDGAHQEHDNGGQKRGSDDPAEKKRSAVNLALTAAEKINAGNGRGGSEKGAERSQHGGEGRRKGQMRL